MKKDYAPKGVKFYFIYKSLAHPEGGTRAYVEPFSLEERLAHIKAAYKELGNTIPWLCDSMKNDLKHALGDRPNSEFIIDPKGKIVSLRDWSRPDSLRSELAKLVGEVKPISPPVVLKGKFESKPSKIQTGVVKRPDIPARMRPLVVQPIESDQPFYVKLRVEAESSLLSGGKGKLYLGFHMDPIHTVHWNNLAAPVTYEISGIASGELSPMKGTAPKVEAESDLDPREFILQASGLRTKSFKVKVQYFACHDLEGWCKPVTQEYAVQIQTNIDGGSARRTRGPTRGSRPTGPPRRPQGGMRQFTAERFLSRDRNDDGKISLEEMPPQMRRMFDRMDSNRDGFVDRKEAADVENRMKSRRRR